MVISICPYFTNCAGCNLQHLDYSQQLEQKKIQISKLLNFEDIKIFSDKEYHYRNRMDFIVRNRRIGLRGKNNQLVEVGECIIAEEKINQLLQQTREYFENKEIFLEVKYLVIRTASGGDSISAVVSENSTKIKELVEELKQFTQKTSCENILLTYIAPNEEDSISTNFIIIKGTDILSETLLGKRFFFSAQGFFQNNTAVAEKMQQYVNNIISKYNFTKTREATLLDLYSGVGTFGIINAELFKRVILVEGFNPCAEISKKNIIENNAKNTESLALDAKYIGRIKVSPPVYIITDPPRSGMDEKTIIKIKELNSESIIYISCNPQQLAKDLKKFKNYRLKSAAIFDLFPQTNHVEVVVELEKRY